MAGSPKYRMLALDVDGTIACKDYSVPDRIKQAILDAIGAGVIVSLVTGRIRASALRYASECATNGPTVSHQGAVITAADGVSDLHIERLDPGLATSALSRMRDASVHVSIFANDDIWVEEETEWARQYAVRMKTELRMDQSLDEVAALGPTVVMAVDEPERITKLAGVLRTGLGPHAAVTQSLPHFCEVASAMATKAQSLSKVCAEYGIGQHEVIAVGDGEGDISMIEWAGLGVAAGDAQPSVTSAADMRIAGPDHEGVAELVQTLLNQGKLGR